MSRQQDAINLLRRGTNKVWPGLYRGKVESTDDPDRLNRVKVRVWAVHADDTATPTTALPWASLSESGGGGYDFGEYDPPPIGASVWIGFEGGDPDFPVILGTFRGAPIRNEDNPNVFLAKDGQPASETTWTPPDGELETPRDVFDDVYGGDPHPTRRVWKKSFKGHTILVEDGDGVEFLRIIDRAGQVIEMDCPVDFDIAKGNAAQRGIRNAMSGDQLDYSAMKYRKAAIRIRDLAGQEIVLDAREQDERIVIKSKSRDSGAFNKIELKSGRSGSGISIEDYVGNILKFDSESDQPIVLQDTSGNAIVFDKENGNIQIKSAKETIEEVPRRTSTIRGKKTDDIRGDEDKRVLGNKKTKIINDHEFGVLGNSSTTVGGALKFVLNNNGPAGPELTNPALEILLSNALIGADFSLLSSAGDIDVETEDGDVAIIASDLVQLEGDDITLLAANTITTDGSEVLLGGPAATDMVLKGTTFQSAMSSYLTAINAAASAILLGTPGEVITWSKAIVAATTALQATLGSWLSAKVKTE